MAKQQKILYLEDDDFPGFNLSFLTGRSGVNERGDVMLIQAFFNFIADDGHISQLGIRSKSDLPGLTGYMDGATLSAIIAFQLRWMSLLLPTVSGTVFPLPKDYRLASLKERRPTLAMLNELAYSSTGGASVALPQAMLTSFPELRPLIKP